MKILSPVAIIFIILSVIHVGCQPVTTEGLTEADQQAIRKATEKALQIGNETEDWTVYTEHYYAPDALILAPNNKAVKGHEDIIAFFESFPPISEMKFEIVEIDGAGDVAYVYGKYYLTLAGEEPVKDTGKYIEIWKRQPDGLWKVAIDIFNSGLP